jgi:HAD superfamily hydrolase (TIGR01549 family)
MTSESVSITQDIDLRNIEAVFFDRGNVTHDCRSGFSDSQRESETAITLAQHLCQLSGRVISPAKIQEHLINPWKHTFPLRKTQGREQKLEPLIEAVLSFLQIESAEQVITETIALFGKTYIKTDIVNAGVASVMKLLKGANRKVGIISNSIFPDEVYIDKYQQDGLDQYIDSYTFSYSADLRKPDKRMIDLACTKLIVAPDKCILVGDKLNVDIICAQQAGASSVWYNPDKEENGNGIFPDYTVGSFREMEKRIAI